MNMKIYTLVDNSSKSSLYKCEHGFSVYIETPAGNLVFDTGQSGIFMENAEKLGLNLENADYLALSHAHYDHCGGVEEFFKTFKGAELLVSSIFFQRTDKYHIYPSGKEKYIGCKFDREYFKKNSVKIRELSDNVSQIFKDVYVVTGFNRKYPFETLNDELFVKSNKGFVLDDFDEEISIVLDTEKGLVVIVGCSHPGILNILDDISDRFEKNIYAVIGGTHLKDADSARIEKTSERLNELGIKLIGVSHCTGDLAADILSKNCKNFFVNNGGNIIEF